MSEEGNRIPNHPSFENTPVVIRSRVTVQNGDAAPAKRSRISAQDEAEGPVKKHKTTEAPAKKNKTGGFPCDVCGKTYKTLITLGRHKCKKSLIFKL